MNERQWCAAFALGIALLGGAVGALAWRARAVATEQTHRVLCRFPAGEVTRAELDWNGTDTLALARGREGAWRLEAPFAAPADPVPVARLLDLLTLQPVADMRSEGELTELGEDVSDFGFAPPCLTVRLDAGARRAHVMFGARTATGAEIYARVEGLRNVFTLPADVFDALPRDLDAFRPRTVLDCPPEEIAQLDLRVPEKPAVKLARVSGAWRIEAPAAAPADEAAVAALVGELLSARVAAFERPSREHPEVSPEGTLAAAELVGYGLAADAGLALNVRTASGATEQIVFGAPAGTNHVWALVRNGAAVVKLSAALAEMCRAGAASLRDTRVVPLADGEETLKLSVTAGEVVYVLARDAEGVWRLESPVVAPADAAAAAALAARVLRLKEDDLPGPDAAGGAAALHVAVVTSARRFPAVALPGDFFGPQESLADLRSKTLLELDSATVRRLSVKRAGGAERAVRWDAERARWNLERTADAAAADGGAARRVNAAAVKALLAALARVEAESVESVSATSDNLRRCGLIEPETVVAVDVESADAVRQNLLLGSVAPGGGRYATVGGADAVFIVSKRTAAELAAELTE